MFEKMIAGTFTMLLMLSALFLVFRFPMAALIIVWLVFVVFAIIVDGDGE